MTDRSLLVDVLRSLLHSVERRDWTIVAAERRDFPLVVAGHRDCLTVVADRRDCLTVVAGHRDCLTVVARREYQPAGCSDLTDRSQVDYCSSVMASCQQLFDNSQAIHQGFVGFTKEVARWRLTAMVTRNYFSKGAEPAGADRAEQRRWTIEEGLDDVRRCESCRRLCTGNAFAVNALLDKLVGLLRTSLQWTVRKVLVFRRETFAADVWWSRRPNS